ncbi:hypothetical protein [Immundisolibacter sp.]
MGKAGRVIVSGFHPPLEQQVMRSVLRRKGCVVKVLARGLGGQSAGYRPQPAEREPLAAGRKRAALPAPPRCARCRSPRGWKLARSP